MHSEPQGPHYNIDNSYLSKAIFRAWPKDKFNVINNITDAKIFYSKAYSELILEANSILKLYHPGSWIKIAYIELEAWSLLHWLDDESKIKMKLEGPTEMAAAGRYGWRYIIEICLEKCKNIDRQYSSSSPSDNHIDALFGIIVSLTQVSEISNYLHYLPQYFGSINIQFSPYIFYNLPELNNEDNRNVTSIRQYISDKNNYNTYPGFDPYGNEEFKNKIDDFLSTVYKCSINEIKDTQNIIHEKICKPNGASILIDSYQHFVSLCSYYTGYETEKVKNILSLLLLNSEDVDYAPRDFLNKSQPKRMLNYCGVHFKLERNHDSVYDSVSSTFVSTLSDSFHIIISPAMMVEWEANFYFRTALGQRTDLKSKSKVSLRKLSDLEDYYHKKIFETELMKIFESIGFICIPNIKKHKNISLPCGEIDMICYREKDNSIIVVEAKSSSPTYDARAMGRSISDHYKQKRYHDKFLRKISWVSNNLDAVEDFFEARGIKNIKIEKNAGNYFVTAFPSVMKFFCEEYTVLKYDEITNHFKLL